MHLINEAPFMIWVGSLTGKSMAIDVAGMLVLNTDFLKGVPFGLALFLVWMNDRVFALRMLMVIFFSIVIARITQNFFFSPRPIMVPEIAEHFAKIAIGARLDLNSFPSDHMALYFPLALMTSLKYRKLGIGLIVWSILGVALPRVFFGRHYPSDILGGMLVGTLTFAFVWKLKAYFDPVFEKVSQKSITHPLLSTSLIFILCFQVSTVFDSARWIFSSAKDIVIFYFLR